MALSTGSAAKQDNARRLPIGFSRWQKKIVPYLLPLPDYISWGMGFQEGLLQTLSHAGQGRPLALIFDSASRPKAAGDPGFGMRWDRCLLVARKRSPTERDSQRRISNYP
jgi:hypothetical protein